MPASIDSAMARLALACALWFLCGCGNKSTDYWLGKAKDPSAAERLRAIDALKSRPTEAGVVVPTLTEALSDPDAFVRRDAARALGEFGPEAQAAVPSLLGLKKDRENVRRAVAEALDRIDPAAAEQFKKPVRKGR